MLCLYRLQHKLDEEGAPLLSESALENRTGSSLQTTAFGLKVFLAACRARFDINSKQQQLPYRPFLPSAGAHSSQHQAVSVRSSACTGSRIWVPAAVGTAGLQKQPGK